MCTHGFVKQHLAIAVAEQLSAITGIENDVTL
jgi:hypothetical protein